MPRPPIVQRGVSVVRPGQRRERGCLDDFLTATPLPFEACHTEKTCLIIGRKLLRQPRSVAHLFLFAFASSDKADNRAFTP